MQFLMEDQAIPSIKTSLSQTTQHRCANPVFKLSKTVNEGDPITFYHHSIKENKDIPLTTIHYSSTQN